MKQSVFYLIFFKFYFYFFKKLNDLQLENGVLSVCSF